MKINELKAGDKIKFHYSDNSVKTGFILSIEDKRVKASSTESPMVIGSRLYSFHESKLISKLEPVAKEIEIGIEHPIPPLSFKMTVKTYESKIVTNMDELMRYGRYDASPTILGAETQIEATADNGQRVYMKLPYSLAELSLRPLKVTIEEVE